MKRKFADIKIGEYFTEGFPKGNHPDVREVFQKVSDQDAVNLVDDGVYRLSLMTNLNGWLWRRFEMAVNVKIEKNVPPKDIFFEGNLVESDSGCILLVTVPAMGYEESLEGTFWGIDLTKKGYLISGGNYQKDLFKQFLGHVLLEGKL